MAGLGSPWGARWHHPPCAPQFPFLAANDRGHVPISSPANERARLMNPPGHGVLRAPVTPR